MPDIFNQTVYLIFQTFLPESYVQLSIRQLGGRVPVRLDHHASFLRLALPLDELALSIFGRLAQHGDLGFHWNNLPCLSCLARNHAIGFGKLAKGLCLESSNSKHKEAACPRWETSNATSF